MSNALWQLFCADCEAALSVALAELPGPPRLIREVTGWPLVPPGFVYRATEDCLSFAPHAGELVVNRLSLPLVTETGVRDDGCCGPGGRSGSNLSCPRGHPIGTEIGDCDSVGGVHLPPAGVLLRPASESADRYRLLTFAPSGPVHDVATFARWLSAEEQLPSAQAANLVELMAAWRRRAPQPTIVEWVGGGGHNEAWTSLQHAFELHEPFFYLWW